MFKKTLFATILLSNIICFSEIVSPEIALQKLTQGNNRYISNQMLHPNRGFDTLQNQIVSQNPFAIILGCSDSRVPPEIIFDQGLGDLFIVRVAGNILGKTELESLKFSIKYLSSSLVVVLGHQNCGAVKAVLEGYSDEFEGISSYVKKITKQANGSLEEATVLNVKQTVEKLKNSSYLKKILSEKKIQIIGAIYSLETGRVTFLD